MRLRLFAAVVAFVTLVPVTATAQETTDMPDDVLDALGVSLDDVLEAEPNEAWHDLGLFSDDALRLLEVATEPSEFIEYAFADDPTGTPVIEPTGARPTGSGSMLWTLPDSWTPPSEGLTDTMAFAQTSGTQLAPGDTIMLMWVEFDSDYDFTSGLVINEGFPMTIPGYPVWNSTYPGDTWEGANVIPNAWFENGDLQLDVYQYDGANSFPMIDLASFYYRSGDVMAMAVSADGLASLAEAAQPAAADGAGATKDLLWRGDSSTQFAQSDRLDILSAIVWTFWTHITTTRQFEPGYIALFTPFEALVIVLVTIMSTMLTWTRPVQVEPTTAPATDDEDTDEADTEVDEVDESDDTETVVDDEGEPATTPVSSGGNTLLILLIIAAIAMIVVGFWLAVLRPRRSRTRTRPEGATPDSGMTYISIPGDDGDDPRDTPPPTIFGEEVEDHNCEWELWFRTAGGWNKLREAEPGKTVCCIYRIELETRILSHAQAASFRQDVQPERLYIPDLNFSWSGLDYHQNTSTRSGPLGRQDWMHGDGNPVDQSALGEPESYWQRGQGSEPPEVAAHLRHEEITHLSVTLEAGCLGHENTYEGSAKATINTMSTHECTNDNPGPACPVELNAFGDSLGFAIGDLNLTVLEATGTDIDELERHAAALKNRDFDDPTQASPPPLPVIGRWDGHDHGVRDRITYQGSDSNSDSNTIENDVFDAFFYSSSMLDAGQIVPQHVWPSTERVTTHIESGFRWEVTLKAEMKKEPCDPGPCTGHPGNACHDRPGFSLELSSSAQEIGVDGKFFDLSRKPGANRHAPPGSGAYEPWEASLHIPFPMP